MLVGLINRAAWIIHEGRPALFNVRAKNVSDRLIAREVHQSPDARNERWKLRVAYIKTPRIDTVSRHKDAGLSIVQGDARIVMTGNRNQIQHSRAQIDLRRIVRPFPDPESLLQLRDSGRHKLDIRHALKLRVAGDMVPVGM